MDESCAAVSMILVVILFLILSILFAQMGANDTLKQQAIQHGYAQYCPKNGEWHWKNECGVNK